MASSKPLLYTVPLSAELDQAGIISIVIPARGRSELLDRCLASVREQKGVEYEVFVIDDGSPADDRPTAAAADRCIRYEHNVGPAFARNLGVWHARGKILLFLDTDTELRPDTLVKLPGLFDADPLLGAVGGSGPPDQTGDDVQFISAKSYDSFGRSAVTKYRPSESPTGLHDCAHVEAAFLAVRREAFEEIGGFDSHWGYMGEDRDFCLRLRDAGYRVAACLDTRAIHHNLGIKGKGEHSQVEFVKFFQAKCLQVALKRDGIVGGLKWLVGHHYFARQPSHLAGIVASFRRYPQLKARRNGTHHTDSNLCDFYGRAVCDALDKQHPFSIRYPLRLPRNVTFFAKGNDRQDSLYTIVRAANSFSTPVNITLVGGDPFTREGLGETLDELIRLPHTQDLVLVSNGSMPEHIEQLCRHICEQSDNSLQLQLSLSGLESTHDAIGDPPKGFQKVLECCERGRRLAVEFDQFSFVISITAMNWNLSQIEPLIDEFEERGYPSQLSLVRGNSASTSGAKRDIVDGEVDQNENVALAAAETSLSRIASKHPAYLGPDQQEKIRIIMMSLRTGRPEFVCQAGYEDAVIYSDGGVAICEHSVPFGNLESWDWDLARAWNSIDAMDHRMKLTDCACVEACSTGLCAE